MLIVWFYNMSDKDAPEMRFTAMDLTYDSSTTESDLLGGVMAYDAVDGEITDRIVVEKTILDEEQQTAVVYYAVSDLSGNVTKQSRVFPADIDDVRGIKAEEEEKEVKSYPGMSFGVQDETTSGGDGEEGASSEEGENTQGEESGENTENGKTGN